ncbi:MAG: deiodinase family protein [Pirellulales bacterium]
MNQQVVKTIISACICLILGPTVCLSKQTVSKEQSSWKAWDRLTDEQTWALLPQVVNGTKGKLPNWIKPVASQMPRTAAAMLQLDAAFRDKGPLDAKLRAKLRWIIANTNKSPYGQAVALLDYRRAGGRESKLQEFTGPVSNWPKSEQDDFEFARLLSVAAPTIPDELFERLKSKHGELGVAAMVLLTAYSNYQDRLLLGLNVPVEKDGPYPPLELTFVDGAIQATPLIPGENGTDEYVSNGQAVTTIDSKLRALTYEQLQSRLEKQRDRQPRLKVPSWDEVKTKLPEAMAVRPTAIRWSLINYGYAAELAIPWTLMTRTHWAENPSSRILEESLFWVQTRALECNYCMGHCEMLLEVAGLNKDQVANRTRLLADSDWAKFPAVEQRAYAYAQKLTLQPSQLTQADYQSLESDFGTQRAMSIFVWLCRGLYMTRISDGFQLTLERDNVFAPPKPAPAQPAPTTPSNSSVSLREDQLTQEAAKVVSELRRTLPEDSEAIAMLNDILKGSTLGPEDGWFPLAQAVSRFDWQYVKTRYDANSDDKIEPSEMSVSEAEFKRLDRTKDGKITESDLEFTQHSLMPSPGSMLYGRLDTDANGKVSREEFLKLFEKMSEGGDFAALDDFKDELPTPSMRLNSTQADNPSKSTLVIALKNQELGSLQAGPKLNEQAPDFKLSTLDSREVQLSSIVREKPTVLIFGNFTCGPFRSQSGNIQKLYDHYKDRAHFFLVYVREAHPSDGWWMQSNQRVGIDLKQPLDNLGRRKIAETCQRHLSITIPFLVDTIDDKVGSTYSGMPNRLYLIDTEGRVAFKNGRGPFGFHARQLEQALLLLLNDSKEN